MAPYLSVHLCTSKWYRRLRGYVCVTPPGGPAGLRGYVCVTLCYWLRTAEPGMSQTTEKTVIRNTCLTLCVSQAADLGARVNAAELGVGQASHDVTHDVPASERLRRGRRPGVV
eukprot:6322308-Pyramimonas_sp.AAC.1